jgi:hypothetical protein
VADFALIYVLLQKGKPMFELQVTLGAVDRGDLREQLLTFALIQKARLELEGEGVDEQLRAIKLDQVYAARLHCLYLVSPATGETIVAYIDSVDLKPEAGFTVGVNISGSASKLEAQGIDFSKFDLTVGKRRKVHLYYVFDWYEESEPLEGKLKLDSIK